MYTRSFLDSDEKIEVPKGYDGCAFPEKMDGGVGRAGIQAAVAEPKISPRDEPAPKAEKEDVPTLSAKGFFTEKLASLPFLDGLLNFKLGMEEILIIALAVFLFFSREGDRECAVMLLLLLFI